MIDFLIKAHLFARLEQFIVAGTAVRLHNDINMTGENAAPIVLRGKTQPRLWKRALQPGIGVVNQIR
ncbi:hypothetical protein SODG_002116 [Sodalis praecaptivus]